MALSASVDNERPEARKTIKILPPAPDRRRFRFLEPRRLSIDTVSVFEKGGDADAVVESGHGGYPLHGDCQYEIKIHPLREGIQRIKIRDIQGKVHVRNVEKDSVSGTWTHSIDVSMGDLFRKPEVLYYDVEADGQQLSGEIAICLQPPRLRYWQAAIAFGLALTFQGIVALGRFLNRVEFDLSDLMTDFTFREDFNLLFLTSIPVFWGMLRLGDWLYYRLRN